MKKFSAAFFVSFLFILVFFSCTKINEATQIGTNLLTADNIHTFEVSLSTLTDNRLFTNDTTLLGYTDDVAVGQLNDPEFGTTNANTYFMLSAPTYGTYPFVSKDSVIHVDSVVLSLSYAGSYGDSLASQSVNVYEINPNANFVDTTGYTFTDFGKEPPIGTLLGSAAFTPHQLRDSVYLSQKVGDTLRKANVLRVKLDNAFANRFLAYDTAGAYKNDSTFKTYFKGLAVQSMSGNSLSYFVLSDQTNTTLTFYIRAGSDTTSVNFTHTQRVKSNGVYAVGGQANIIRRNPSGNYLAYLTNNSSQDDKIYLQSQPGSYAAIRIPALDTFSNKLIHRAELVITKLPSAQENIFTPPYRLFVDRINGLASPNDTAFAMERDLGITTTGSDFVNFGGTLLGDNTYRINISRYVQSVITQHLPNDTLRLYAPLRTILFASNLNARIPIGVLSQVANGRVVLGGGSYADSTSRLRLRIIYSNL